MANRSKGGRKQGGQGGRASPADPVSMDDFSPFSCGDPEAGWYRLPALQQQPEGGAGVTGGDAGPWADCYRLLTREGATSKLRFSACLMRLTALMRLAAAGDLGDRVRAAGEGAGYLLVHESALCVAATLPMVRLGHFDGRQVAGELAKLPSPSRT